MNEDLVGHLVDVPCRHHVLRVPPGALVHIVPTDAADSLGSHGAYDPLTDSGGDSRGRLTRQGLRHHLRELHALNLPVELRPSGIGRAGHLGITEGDGPGTGDEKKATES